MKNKILKLFYYSWKRISERSKRKDFKKKLKKEIDLFHHCKKKKDSNLIKSEMKMLKKYWMEFPYQYFVYGLYRKDRNLSESELKGFIPFFFAKYVLYPKSYKAYLPLTGEKRITKTLFTGLNIPHTKTLFEVYNQKFVSSENQELSINQINVLIASEKSEKIFIKPNKGSQGEGTYIFNKNGDGHFIEIKNHEKLDINLLNRIKKQGDFIVEPGIEQHHLISKIYPYSVNTIRFLTEYKKEKSSIIVALFRFGKNKYQVDNAHFGGIFCKIDLTSGIICDHATDYNFIIYEKHPDTGTNLKGFEVPFWKETIALMRKSIFKFRYFTYLGWDVAITPQGPIVIEVNGSSDFELLQLAHGPLKDQLGIKSPKSYYLTSNYRFRDL